MIMNSLESLITEYLIHLQKERNYSPSSVLTTSYHLSELRNWAHKKGYYRVNDFTREVLLEYQNYLYHYQKKNREGLSNLTQRQRVSKVRLFFSWLSRRDIILYNPAYELELPKKGHNLPKAVLSSNQVEEVMKQTNIKTQRGIRDRAILETFYSTGIRRSELISLTLNDIDYTRGTLMVRKGKGGMDRLIPIGERALKWIEKYISCVRGYFVNEDHKEVLFLTNIGLPFKPVCLGHIVREYVNKAKVGRTGSCHLFRHTMATLMLENGASIRYVQQMLGHSSIDTTEIYTHISISKLREIHRQTHPSAYKMEVELNLSEESIPPDTSIKSLLDQYLTFIRKQKSYVEATVKRIGVLIMLFINYFKIGSVKEVREKDYEGYEKHVYSLKKKDGEMLDSVTQYDRVYYVIGFLNYLYERRLIDFSIEKELDKPYRGKRAIELWSVDEIEMVLDEIDVTNYVGLRDKAMFETLYSSGMTRSELRDLRLSDIDTESKTLKIRSSREIPLTDRAVFWIKEYLRESRNQFVKKDSGYLFLTQKSGKCTLDTLILLSKKYKKKANRTKELSCYVFRESWKSFMRENGASAQFIETMAGKAKTLPLETLKTMLGQYHPAKMKTIIKIIPEEKSLLMNYLLEYLEWMRVHNYSKKSLENRKSYVKKFITYCRDRGIEEPKEVTKSFLSRYQRHIYHESSEKTGEPLSTAERHYRISHVMSFFSYLVKMNHILYNPTADIELAKTPKSLPSNVLTEAEAETILNQADTSTPSGVRDRALLESFYSTGIRRKELSNVRLCDIDFEERSLMIRAGKCKKDRLVPIGERALDWITRYLTSVRPLFLKDTKSEYLFLTPWGTQLSGQGMGTIVKGYVEKAGIKKSGSSILFRHTMATLMLENGADIRYIQQMLGHKRLKTTQIYTHVSIGKLKEVHNKTHPAKLPHKNQLDTDPLSPDYRWLG